MQKVDRSLWCHSNLEVSTSYQGLLLMNPTPFTAVSSSLLPSVSLLVQLPPPFLLSLQPYTQYCVPLFPIVFCTPSIILRTKDLQLPREGGHHKMASIKLRGLQFGQCGNNALLDPVFFQVSDRNA